MAEESEKPKMSRWKRPLWVLPVLVWLSLEVGEFYPISDFPMYSNPTSRITDYVYLGDADDLDEEGRPRPIAMQYLVGVRAAKAKKIFYAEVEKRTRAMKIGKYALPHKEMCKVGEEVLAFLRDRENHMGTHDQLPERMAFVHGKIIMALGDGIRETHTILAVEGQADEAEELKEGGEQE